MIINIFTFDNLSTFFWYYISTFFIPQTCNGVFYLIFWPVVESENWLLNWYNFAFTWSHVFGNLIIVQYFNLCSMKISPAAKCWLACHCFCQPLAASSCGQHCCYEPNIVCVCIVRETKWNSLIRLKCLLRNICSCWMSVSMLLTVSVSHFFLLQFFWHYESSEDK